MRSGQPSGTDVLVAIVLLLCFSEVRTESEDGCAPGPEDGFIVAIEGNWKLVSPGATESEACNNECMLKQGQLVSKGYLFKACHSSDPESPPLSTFFIKIARWDGEIYPISCQPQGSCAVPRSLPHSTVEPDSFTKRLASAASRLFSKRPKRYAPALARGPVLRDVILELHENTVDFGPAFADAPSGRYSLTAKPITNVGLSEPVFSALYVWTTKQPTVPISVNMPSGLYAISAESSAGTLESWVLLAAQPEFGGLQEQFSHIKQITSDWKNSSGISESTRRALLRATLDELSEH